MNVAADASAASVPMQRATSVRTRETTIADQKFTVTVTPDPLLDLSITVYSYGSGVSEEVNAGGPGASIVAFYLPK